MPSFDSMNRFYRETHVYSASEEAWDVFLSHKKKLDGYAHAFTKHKSILSAYRYLQKHPDIEVNDDFFGNGYPFLIGSHCSVSFKDPDVHITDNIIYSNDNVILPMLQIVYNNISSDTLEKYFDPSDPLDPMRYPIVSVHSYKVVFHMSNYEELCEKMSIMTIMTL